jgi:hypothetical protein
MVTEAPSQWAAWRGFLLLIAAVFVRAAKAAVVVAAEQETVLFLQLSCDRIVLSHI